MYIQISKGIQITTFILFNKHYFKNIRIYKREKKLRSDAVIIYLLVQLFFFFLYKK